MQSKTTVLLVEDDDTQRSLIKDILEKEEFLVLDVESCESAILLLKKQTVHVILSDWKLPNLSGLDLLNYVRKNAPELGFVMATAYGTISHAVDAMQSGADDYLTKPFQRQELILAIKKSEKAFLLRKENKTLNEALSSQQKLVDFVGTSDALQKVQDKVRKIAPTDATVLINGESGTGKELVARSLHNLSLRKSNRFVAINCGAIPTELAEAELFGAVKGAFTGAIKDSLGKLAFADNGTVFLDEIAELPLLLQTKLLRFLQEGTITPVGSNEDNQLNVRIVAATHKNLSQMVIDGEFREDLYYRLNIVPLTIPALRERKEDIPLLADFFYQKCCKQYGLEESKLEKPFIDKLVAYDWPGNVRELSNRIERFALLGEITDGTSIDLKPEISFSASNGISGDGFVLTEDGLDFEELEASLLKQSLALAEGNKTKASKLLKMSYKTFLYRLEKHHLN